MQVYKFSIPSMHDENSAKEINSILSKIPGIKDVDLDFEDGIINVYCDEKMLIYDKIKYSIENKGYDLY